MSQPPTPPELPGTEPTPVASDGDRRRASSLLRRLGLHANGATLPWVAEQFAAARLEELRAGDPRVLEPAAEPDSELHAAAELIRRVAATLREPGELGYAVVRAHSGDLDGIRVVGFGAVEEWLQGLAERVLYGGLEQLAGPE